MQPQPTAAAFVAAVRDALAGAGIQPPRVGDACVVLVDTAAWQPWLAAADDLLTPPEQARAARFRFAPDRTAYALAHALWRALLGQCLNMEAGIVPLSTGPSGQPLLPGTALATSLSHSGAGVLIGVGAMDALGVDLERAPPRRALAPLTSTLCTPGEAAALQAMPAATRELALLQLWTRKEALLKAFGVGLAQAPSEIAVPAGGVVAPQPGIAAPACRVHDLRLPAGWVGAVAASSAGAIHLGVL